jgi:hypothetical protein
VKARGAVYPVRRDEERHGQVTRLTVPDEQVSSFTGIKRLFLFG